MKTDYKDIITKNGKAETNEDLLSESPKRNERFVFNNVAMEDEDTTITNLRLGVSRGGVIFWICEEKTPTGGALYWWENDIYLYFGERLIVRFVGTNDGDRLAVYIIGYREDLSDI